VRSARARGAAQLRRPTGADILEAIVGSFHTGKAPAELPYVKRDDRSFLISGWMPHSNSPTCSASICRPRPSPTSATRSRLPAGSSRFVDLDGRRIDKALAKRLNGTLRSSAPVDNRGQRMPLS
jgi:putative hemolysin